MGEAVRRLVLGVVNSGEETLLFVREQESGSNAPVSVLRSADGLSFSSEGEEMVFTKLLGSLRLRSGLTEPFRVSSLSPSGDAFFLSFKKHERDGSFRAFSSISYDGIEWARTAEILGVREYGVAAALDEGYALFFGERTVKLALSPDLKHWTTKRSSLLRPREGHFDEQPLSILAAVPAGQGILLLYLSENHRGRKVLGSALVAKHDPKTVLWRTEEAIWEAPEDWDGREIRAIGAIPKKGKVLLYFQIDGRLLVEEIAQFWKISRGKTVSIVSDEVKLRRYDGNPILGPRKENDWEAGEAFNPAAFLSDDGQVHILYRAVGRDGLSSVGYASSRDGFSIDERLDYPVYASSATLNDVRVTRMREKCAVPYASGGGWGGSEDPKLTRVDDTIYMTYTAFDGYNFPRVALTKIALDDFLAKKWDWSRPVMISPPGEIHKNWTIFPEKIKGKFAILHSISPEVRVDYFDSLDAFDGETFIRSEHSKTPLRGRWELLVRGVGPSPIKTKEGWLVLYHATTRDCGYKLGAMLLDLKDPTRIVARSKAPLLEPRVWYENEGTKPRIVYSCGAVVKDETLFVYYGGADTVTCVATVPLSQLLGALLHGEKATPTRYVKLGNE